MHPIHRETIFKPGDRIVDTRNREKWQIISIKGAHFYLKNIYTNEHKWMHKNEMVVHPDLKFELGDDRGYY